MKKLIVVLAMFLAGCASINWPEAVELCEPYAVIQSPMKNGFYKATCDDPEKNSYVFYPKRTKLLKL